MEIKKSVIAITLSLAVTGPAYAWNTSSSAAGVASINGKMQNHAGVSGSVTNYGSSSQFAGSFGNMTATGSVINTTSHWGQLGSQARNVTKLQDTKTMLSLVRGDISGQGRGFAHAGGQAEVKGDLGSSASSRTWLPVRDPIGEVSQSGSLSNKVFNHVQGDTSSNAGNSQLNAANFTGASSEVILTSIAKTDKTTFKIIADDSKVVDGYSISGRLNKAGDIVGRSTNADQVEGNFRADAEAHTTRFRGYADGSSRYSKIRVR